MSSPSPEPLLEDWDQRLARREAEIRKRMESRARVGSPVIRGLAEVAGSSSGAEGGGQTDGKEYHYRRRSRYSTIGLSPSPDDSSLLGLRPIRSSTPTSSPQATSGSLRNRFATHDGTYLSPLSASSAARDRMRSDPDEGTFPPTDFSPSGSGLRSYPILSHPSPMTNQMSSSPLRERYRSFGATSLQRLESSSPSPRRQAAGTTLSTPSTPIAGEHPQRRPTLRGRSHQRLSLIGMTTEPGYEPLCPVVKNETGTGSVGDSDEELLRSASKEGSGLPSADRGSNVGAGLLSPYACVESLTRRASLKKSRERRDSGTDGSDEDAPPSAKSVRRSTRLITSEGATAEEQAKSLHRLSVYFADPYCASPKLASSRPSSVATMTSSSPGLSNGSWIGDERPRSSLAGPYPPSPARTLHSKSSVESAGLETALESEVTPDTVAEIPRITEMSASPETSSTTIRPLESPFQSPRPVSLALSGRPLSSFTPPTPPPKVALPVPPIASNTRDDQKIPDRNVPNGVSRIDTAAPKDTSSPPRSPARMARLREGEEEAGVTKPVSGRSSPTTSIPGSPKWIKREQAVRELRESGGWVLGLGADASPTNGIYKFTKGETCGTPPSLSLPNSAYFPFGHRHTDSNTLDEVKISVSPSPKPIEVVRDARATLDLSPGVGPGEDRTRMDFPLPPVRSSSLRQADHTNLSVSPATGLHIRAMDKRTSTALDRSSRDARAKEPSFVDLTSRPSTPTKGVQDSSKDRRAALIALTALEAPVKQSARTFRGASIDSVSNTSQDGEILDDFFRRSSSASSPSTAPSSIIQLTPESTKRFPSASPPQSPTSLTAIHSSVRSTILRLETLEELMEGLLDARLLDLEDILPITPKAGAFPRSATATPKLAPPRNSDAASHWGEVEIPRFRSHSAQAAISPANVASTKTSPALARAPSLEYKFGSVSGRTETWAGVRKSALPLPVQRQMSSPGALSGGPVGPRRR